MYRMLLGLSRPLVLLLAAFTYLLGAGIARYLGFDQHPGAFWLGLGWSLLACLSASLLAEYFRPLAEPLVEGETPRQREDLRRVLLLFAGLALVFLGALTTLLLAAGRLTPPVAIVLVLAFAASLAYALPPLRLVYSGYGELVQAIFLADLLPVLACLLQTESLHRILPAVTFPLTLLALACLLVQGFFTFAADQKHNRLTLVRRLGWERAIPLHNIFLLLAYFLFAAAPLLGFPLALFWPVFLTLPLAVLQIYWLKRIADGAPPRWTFLNALSLSLFGLAVYLLTLTFWIR